MNLKRKRFEVTCAACYPCVIGETNSKREANQIATSHMGMYHHDVHIRDLKPIHASQFFGTLDERQVTGER